MARCLVGCGSNRGSRREQLDTAIELLRSMPGVVLRSVSRYRETAPVGGPRGQPPFLNAACLVDADLGPREVLDTLAAVEKTLHRDRTERWGPRTIDLDLLLYGDRVIDSPDLTVPHPRMSTRRFVLEPAAEIAGDMPHPTAGCTVRDLLDAISAPDPLIVVVGVPGSGAADVATAVSDALLARVLHAPSPTPDGSDGMPVPIACWKRTLAAWAAPLDRVRWEADSTATIADYWCDALVTAAADDLGIDELGELRAEADAIARRSVAPSVALVLVAGREALEERNARNPRETALSRSGGFADGGPATLACDGVGRLLRMQERLLRQLRGPGRDGGRSPRAVVTIAADDLQRAIAEATAAVEAML